MRWKPVIITRTFKFGGLVVVMLALGACSTIDLSLLEDVGIDPAKAEATVKKIEDATLGNAAKALPIYCKAPRSARVLFRERFNNRPEAKGAKLVVWCPGDPVLTLGS